MPAPHSNDLRKRIVETWLEGKLTWEEIAERFCVGLATVNRLVGRFRETGSVEPKAHGGGHEHRIPDEKLPVLRSLLEMQPDATLPALVERYEAETDVRVSNATMGRAIRRLGFTRKKSRSSPPSATVHRSRQSARSSSRR